MHSGCCCCASVQCTTHGSKPSQHRPAERMQQRQTNLPEAQRISFPLLSCCLGRSRIGTHCTTSTCRITCQASHTTTSLLLLFREQVRAGRVLLEPRVVALARTSGGARAAPSQPLDPRLGRPGSSSRAPLYVFPNARLIKLAFGGPGLARAN